MTDRNAERDALRDHFLALYKGLPPRLHLAFTVGGSLLILALGVFMGRAATWLEILSTMAACIIFADFVEREVHEKIMHRRVRHLEAIYDSHTPRHHRLYTMRAMHMRDAREWPFVLMGVRECAGLAVIAMLASGAAAAVFGPDVGWLAFATFAGYVALYELTHLSFHLPEAHHVSRWSWIRFLARHHTRHHDQGLMSRWNMNIWLPLADWCRGTIAPPELLAERDKVADRTARSAQH